MSFGIDVQAQFYAKWVKVVQSIPFGNRLVSPDPLLLVLAPPLIEILNDKKEDWCIQDRI